MEKKLISEEIQKMRKMMGLNEQSNPYQFNEQNPLDDMYNESMGDKGYATDSEPEESAPSADWKVDPAYTHFALNKKEGKIYTGWEYEQDLDAESIKYYCTNDLKDWFGDTNRPSDFTVLTKRGCMKKGINPFDTNNWKKGI